jgi:hypothetical protein
MGSKGTVKEKGTAGPEEPQLQERHSSGQNEASRTPAHARGLLSPHAEAQGSAILLQVYMVHVCPQS